MGCNLAEFDGFFQDILISINSRNRYIGKSTELLNLGVRITRIPEKLRYQESLHQMWSYILPNIILGPFFIKLTKY